MSTYAALVRGSVLAVSIFAASCCISTAAEEVPNCARLLEQHCGDRESYIFKVKVAADWKIAEVLPESRNARTEAAANCWLLHPGRLADTVRAQREHGAEAPYGLTWTVGPLRCEIPLD